MWSRPPSPIYLPDPTPRSPSPPEPEPTEPVRYLKIMLEAPEDACPIERRNWDIVFRVGASFDAADREGATSSRTPVAEASGSASTVTHAPSASEAEVSSASETTMSGVTSDPVSAPEMHASSTPRIERQPAPEHGTSEEGAQNPIEISPSDTANFDIFHIFQGSTFEPDNIGGPSVKWERKIEHPYNLGEQLYRIPVIIQDKLFYPAVDTGSNASWLRVYEAKVFGIDPECKHWRPLTDEELEDLEREAGETPPGHQFLEGYYPYGEEDKGQVYHGYVSYSDLSRTVWFGLPPDQLQNCTFPTGRTFSASHSELSKVRAALLIAFAYGWTRPWVYCRADGVFSFGLLSHFSPSAFFNEDHERLAPQVTTSIMKSLHDPLVKTPSGGFSLHFALYPKATEKPSWMSVNGWPDKPHVQWSEQIPVMSPESNKLWEVNMLSFGIARGHIPEPLPGAAQPDTQLTVVPGTEYIFNNGRGIQVRLDTGSSTSWFPSEFLSHLRTNVFPSPYNQEIEEKYRDAIPTIDSRMPSYRVYDEETFGPLDASYPSESIYVVLKFAGFGGTVEQYCPIDGFLVGRSAWDFEPSAYRDGLFNPAPATLEGRYILGLNFFHHVFVALHKEDSGCAYVQLAHRLGGDSERSSPAEFI